MNLGQQTNKKFLNQLIPELFSETVYQGKQSWACDVKGFKVSEENWDSIKNGIIKAFGNNLIEIQELSSRGVRFIVYLRKDT